MNENNSKSRLDTENNNSEKINEIEKLKEKDLKKTIHEQLEYIIKMEQDNRELKLKNSEFKSKNEMIFNELEIIKQEFRNLSEKLRQKNLSKTFFLL